ncbi:MAG: hypothetical protein N2V78_09410 [Methanophagales archaeon]|nr:hypothetical protein [Methanophagales archaeon]
MKEKILLNWKTWIIIIYIATVLSDYLLSLYHTLVASQNSWLIIISYNEFGEGTFELLWEIVTLPIVIYVSYQIVKEIFGGVINESEDKERNP